MKSKIENIGAPNIFRYRSDSDYVIDELENNYILFIDKDNLNNPFDAHSGLIDLTKDESELLEAYKTITENIDDPKVLDYVKKSYNLDSMRKFINEGIDKYILEFGIACFSMTWFNMPLWANYSSNHNGLCLHFDVSLDEEFFNGLQVINYEEIIEPKEYKPTSNQEIMELFYRKDARWKNEEEIRIIRYPKGKHHFKKDSLRSIYLGYNIKSSFKNQIVKTIRNNYEHVRIFQITKPKSLNNISLIEI